MEFQLRYGTPLCHIAPTLDYVLKTLFLTRIVVKLRPVNETENDAQSTPELTSESQANL
jgi:hypothetical protein